MEEDRDNHSAEPSPPAPESIDTAHSTADYSRYQPPRKASRRGRRWLIWLLTVVIVLAGLTAGYKLLKKQPKAHPAATTAQTNPTTSQQPAGRITAATKNYASQNFALSFDYPQDWTVADSGGGVMTLKSPPLALTDASGKITGEVWLVFNAKGKGGLLTGGAAQRDSIKIAYDKPSQAQRANTYVSFATNETTSKPTTIEYVYITGNAGYKAGDTISKTDLAAEDPLVGYAFYACSDRACQASPKQTNLLATTWDDPNFSTPLLNVFKSLVIQ